MKLRLASWRGASAPSRASVHHHANGVTVAGLLGVNLLWASAHTYHSGIDGSGLVAASLRGRQEPRCRGGMSKELAMTHTTTSGLMPLCGYSFDSTLALG